MALSFPPVDLSRDYQTLRTEVRGFLARSRFTPATSSWMVHDPEFSRACGAAGFVAMTWPKQYGGHERASLERYVVMEEMLAAGAPVGSHWIADRQSGPQILRHGSAALRDRVLPGIARGEIYFVIGMSEPDAGSDLANIRSRATKVEGGWRLSGRKTWTTNAHVAHYMIGLFRTVPRDDAKRHAGMTQFVVDLHAPGVNVRPIVNMAGHSEFNDVTFDDVFVPDEHVLGQPGEGWSLVMGELAFERSGPERFLSVFPLLASAADAIANADATNVDAAHVDADKARSFGRLVTHTAALREMSMSIAARLASGEPLGTEAALVKDLGNALEQEVPEVLAGMVGIVPLRGHDEVHHDYAALLAETMLAAPSFTLRGGTPQVLRGIIAKGLGLS